MTSPLGRPLAGLCASLLVLGLLGIVVVTASAATYSVWSCRGPTGEPVSTAAWTPSAFDDRLGGVTIDDDCAGGGALELSLSPGTSFPAPLKPHAIATFDLPPDGRVASYALWRSIRTAIATPGGDYQYAAAITEESASGSIDIGCASAPEPPSFPCDDVGDPADPFALANRLERSGLELDALSAWAGCLSAGCEAPPPAAPASAELRIFGARVDVVDDAAPVVTRATALLAEPRRGGGTVVVDGVDTGGGIAAGRLSIDGRPAGVAVAGGPTCREPYTLPQPCPSATAVALGFATDALAEGAHSASGALVDAAGNETTFGPLWFEIDRRTPGAAAPIEADNGVPAVRVPRLRLDRRRVVHRPRRPAVVRGTLAAANGAPIAGARLEVSLRDLASPGDRARALRPVVTSAAGRFAIRLRGAGARRWGSRRPERACGGARRSCSPAGWKAWDRSPAARSSRSRPSWAAVGGRSPPSGPRAAAATTGATASAT